MCAGRGEGEKVEDVVPRRPHTYVHILQNVIGDVRLYFSLNLKLQILGSDTFQEMPLASANEAIWCPPFGTYPP
jgi:hypothetical protein